MRYVVTCSHRFSEHAAVFLRIMAERGLLPAGAMIINPLNREAIREQIKRRGVRSLMRKAETVIIDRLSSVGVAEARESSETAALRQMAQSQGVPFKTDINAIATEHGLEKIYVNSLNSDQAVQWLDRQQFDYCVYLGGGILRESFITQVNRRVLNAHSGPLPKVRGMNSIEWTLWLGYRPAVTLHNIDVGIDTGEIYGVYPVPFAPGDSLKQIIANSYPIVVQSLIEGVEKQESGTLHGRPQRKKDGRQYFTMHPYLLEILENKLSNPEWVARLEAA